MNYPFQKYMDFLNAVQKKNNPYGGVVNLLPIPFDEQNLKPVIVRIEEVKYFQDFFSLGEEAENE